MKNIYQERVRHLKTNTSDDLINILKNSDKDFYFVLINFYLNNIDLNKYRLNYVGILRHSIYTLAKGIELEGFMEYYEKYINFKEIEVEIDTLNRELNL